MNVHTVPQVLRCCSEFVETHGVVDGIYRLSGVSSNIQKLRQVVALCIFFSLYVCKCTLYITRALCVCIF